jgi:hypothetical protein
VTYDEFMGFMKQAEVEHNTNDMLPKVSGLPLKKAVELIAQKIGAKMEGGPSLGQYCHFGRQ